MFDSILPAIESFWVILSKLTSRRTKIPKPPVESESPSLKGRNVLVLAFLVPLATTIVAGLVNLFRPDAFLVNGVFVSCWIVFMFTLYTRLALRRSFVYLLGKSLTWIFGFSLLLAGARIFLSLGGNSTGGLNDTLFTDDNLTHYILILSGCLGRNVAKSKSPKKRRHRRTVIYAIIKFGSIIIIAVGLLSLFMKSVIPSMPKITIAHIVIIMITSLIATLVFSTIMLIHDKRILDFNYRTSLLLGLPAGIGGMNLITIIQGYNGLIEHYEFFLSLAFGGMIMAGGSVIIMLIFILSVVKLGIYRRNICHYMLATGLSLGFASIVMYASAEIAGVWLKHIS